MTHYETCPTCKGSGGWIEKWWEGDEEFEVWVTCETCKGTGYVPPEEEK